MDTGIASTISETMHKQDMEIQKQLALSRATYKCGQPEKEGGKDRLKDSFNPLTWCIKSNKTEKYDNVPPAIPKSRPDGLHCSSKKDPDTYRQNRSRLLSLPETLRMMIWKYVLSDYPHSDLFIRIERRPFNPSYKLVRAPVPELKFVPSDSPDSTHFIRIERRPFDPSYKLIRAPVPELKFVHEGAKPRRHVNILLTCRSIRAEALPILYQSVTFAPSDLESLLPIFIDSLSPEARRCIRNIHLALPQSPSQNVMMHDRSKPSFHWAVTCAQVAKLNGTLRHLSVEGKWSDFALPSFRRAILHPLRKIKAEIAFVPIDHPEDDSFDYDGAFGELLRQAGEELKALAQVRAERTKADAEERREKERRWRESGQQKVSDTHGERIEASLVGDNWVVVESVSGEQIEKDLRRVSGIDQFEKELQAQGCDSDDSSIADDMDWDLMSVGSGADTPKVRPRSALSKYSNGMDTDTASTIVVDDASTTQRKYKIHDDGDW
ncbi:hypothetical protein BU24DRAFT_9945 [Aaosphaeria arxii CBS 175.79]|uniref:DUF7730 domain-containing protein n=1 Tax=Aaosphaeria arxii CBS 175.79 TaxID=1450172 RepID=A0A6A5Y5M3_9PLEO|nr:uncharacterized protein BU24DRAFT_9945 [Aaosphaeria arxii CBS 175.79]KAF2020862.1 hypothetical protein BU24DRAFT_9945 [Aaosphaeria arxii CBS 175.79]